jgi:predicted glycosyltransferase involved in capsule biosynthesis
MKYNFKDISFLIHIRVDIPERLRNLELVIEYYHKYCENVEFIIVNDDTVVEPRIKELYKKYPNSKFMFMENNSTYKRTLAFNKAFLQTDRDIVIAGDTDIIIHPKYIIEGAEVIKSGKANHVFPYNGVFCWVRDNLINEFVKELDIAEFEKYTPTLDQRNSLHQDSNILIAHNHSKGGCIMYSSELYKSINGYNPGFIGWGFEDDEINHRIIELGGITARVHNYDAIAWHLNHPNTVRDEHPFYRNNYNISNYVHTLKGNQLKEYIKTWNI